MGGHKEIKQSQKAKILAALRRGEKLTVTSAKKNYGTNELRTYIADLLKTMEIKKDWVYRKDKKFKVYYL